MGKNGRTGIQLLRWSYPFYGRILWNKDWKPRKINPIKCSLKKQEEIQKKFKEKEIGNFQRFQGWWFRGWAQGQNVLPVPWHMWTYHGQEYYIKNASQTSKIEETNTLWEKEKVHQILGEYHGTKTG